MAAWIELVFGMAFLNLSRLSFKEIRVSPKIWVLVSGSLFRWTNDGNFSESRVSELCPKRWSYKNFATARPASLSAVNKQRLLVCC